MMTSTNNHSLMDNDGISVFTVSTAPAATRKSQRIASNGLNGKFTSKSNKMQQKQIREGMLDAAVTMYNSIVANKEDSEKNVPLRTFALIHEAFGRMDELDLFPRVQGKRPFLLLDGHDSRFDLHFLQYIRNKNLPWCCCIGLPYGTHLWQVGDSPAQNGNYKYFEQEFKDQLLRTKTARGLPFTFKPTDIIPTVNHAWKKSFAVVTNNKKAILERGWFPANKALLTHPDVLRTQSINTAHNLIGADIMSANNNTDTTTTVLNTNIGMAAWVLETAINGQRNNPDAMKARQKRMLLGEKTKEIEQVTTKKLTSGTAFF